MRVLALVAIAAACGDNITPGDDRQGGETTVDDRSADAFTHPAANLTTDQKAIFLAGRGPFDFQWEIPQLGPLYNNDSCFGCHGGNGRGRSQIGADGARIDINGPQSEALVRCSLYDGTPADPGGNVPVPGLGLQLQDHATVGLAEIVATLSFVEHTEQLGDGELISLREPRVAIRIANGGFLPNGTLTSYRQAPPIVGLGLLEAIDEATLRALADPDDADGDGISGRVNEVWNPETSATEVGRFGWKSNAPTLHVQTAGAAANDMGLSSKVFPDPGGQRDVNDDQLEQMTFMVQTIGVPAAGPRGGTELRGRVLFDQLGCASCHVPTLVTGDHPITALAHQTIHPYTDLLLHDMGDLLTDGRPDFAATINEWRTPALWGLGLAQVIRPDVTFLHDGRARTLAEAIMWHGGEADAAREGFRTAAKSDREALIAFLLSL